MFFHISDADVRKPAGFMPDDGVGAHLNSSTVEMHIGELTGTEVQSEHFFPGSKMEEDAFSFVLF